jgi:hypothetical protein
MAQACNQSTTHGAPLEKEVITCAKRQTMAFHPSHTGEMSKQLGR